MKITLIIWLPLVYELGLDLWHVTNLFQGFLSFTSRVVLETYPTLNDLSKVKWCLQGGLSGCFDSLYYTEPAPLCLWWPWSHQVNAQGETGGGASNQHPRLPSPASSHTAVARGVFRVMLQKCSVYKMKENITINQRLRR